MMIVCVLAGGLGVRLRALVPDRPKPMALFKQKPFLDHQLCWLRSQGFTNVILCVGYQAEQIQDYFGDGHAWGLKIRYVVEPALLGTAGAIKNAAAWLDDRFLLLNGDSFLALDLRRLVDFHLQHQQASLRAIATVVAVPTQEAAAYGALQIDEAGVIHRFAEKGRTGPGWVNGGVYLFEPEVLAYIPAQQVVSLEQTTFPRLGARVEPFTFVAHGVHAWIVASATPRTGCWQEAGGMTETPPTEPMGCSVGRCGRTV